MSPIAAIAGVQGRVAQIESRLGISAPPAAVRASSASTGAVGADFESVLSRATSTTDVATAIGQRAGATHLPFGSVAEGGTAIQSLIDRIGVAEQQNTAVESLVGSEVPYSSLFEAAGHRHGVDPALLAAVAKTESGFDPGAVSHAGAQGLMQLMPATAAGLGVADSFDPAQAIDGAARLLAGHLDRFGSTELALAAYNAGPGAVARFDGIPPYAETQAYVPKVLARLQELTR